MASSTPTTASDQLLAELLTEAEQLKTAIDEAANANLSRATLHNVVELATLRTFSLVESFLEGLFYLCVLSDASVAGSGPRLQVSTREEADLLLMTSGSRVDKYLDWLPLERTLELADRYLRDDHPFGRLRYRKAEADLLAELVVVRNAIAHPSDHAWARFGALADRKGYPWRRAGDYLVSLRAGQMEALSLMTTAEIVARSLVAASDTEADSLLSPEPPFQAGANAPSGDYECIRCGTERSHPTAGSLGPCGNCEVLTPCSTCGHKPHPRTTWRRLIQPAAAP